jgi:hypothetical protein
MSFSFFVIVQELFEIIKPVLAVVLAEQVIERSEQALSVGAIGAVERTGDVPCEATSITLHQSCCIEQHVVV